MSILVRSSLVKSKNYVRRMKNCIIIGREYLEKSMLKSNQENCSFGNENLKLKDKNYLRREKRAKAQGTRV